MILTQVDSMAGRFQSKTRRAPILIHGNGSSHSTADPLAGNINIARIPFVYINGLFVLWNVHFKQVEEEIDNIAAVRGTHCF